MGSEAQEGMVRGCRGIVEAQDSSPPSWSPRPWDVGIRLTLYRAVAWMASLCIRDAELIFAGNAYPALTPTHLAKKLFLHP
jgi:hypothetical protein